jgi:hypothetical protein
MIAAAKPNLSDAEYQQFKELLAEYGDIFAMKSDYYQQADRVFNCRYGRDPTDVPNPEEAPPSKTGGSMRGA